MPIEVTSFSDCRWYHSANPSHRRQRSSYSRRIALRIVISLVAIAAILGIVTLLRSYNYYAKLIDARLATGYLTSRPGIYAAPRVLGPGQGLTLDQLALTLRRAGYVEKEGSDLWNGTFNCHDPIVEIHPHSKNADSPQIVQIKFAEDRISEMTGDGLTLESFALEPEVITNDHSSKTSRIKALTFAELPPVLVQAILSIEDRRFFNHRGIDFMGIARALVENAKADGRGSGGSTITQQLVKNTYLSPEHTLQRKYAEAMLAIALERRLSKEDIFALYCNEVYLGQRGGTGARGVDQASRLYFDKELKVLSLSEAAMIAGMIQAPAHYSPDRHPEAALSRRALVLTAMVQSGWISEQEATAAANEPIALARPETTTDVLAPYFTDYVERVASGDWDLATANTRVYTTIDLDLQKAAELAVQRQLQKLDPLFKDSAVKPEASLVALDPHTGRVLAMVGGRNYAESQLNRATDARRQPGSTFKPFVYAAALESGFSPLQMFSDAPRDFVYDRNRHYRPANFGGSYSMREVTMRTGLVKSLNVVTVDVALQTGLARVGRFAQSFGLPRPERYPSIALGTTEVTPIQLAAAYAAFVNGGKAVQPIVIDRMSESNATPSVVASQAVSATTAYMITNMMSGVIDEGTARAARNSVQGVALAGKTGTSRDGWFVGFTPNLVCVVWVGFDDNRQLGLTGAASALPAWVDFVGTAVKLRPELGGRTFECPEGIKFVEIDSDTGLLSKVTCPHRQLIAVAENVQPNLECYKHSNLIYDDGPEKASPPVIEKLFIAKEKRDSKPPVSGIDWARSTRTEVDARGRRTLVNDLH
jgi:penicillin-binding protein 1B